MPMIAITTSNSTRVNVPRRGTRLKTEDWRAVRCLANLQFAFCNLHSSICRRRRAHVSGNVARWQSRNRRRLRFAMRESGYVRRCAKGVDRWRKPEGPMDRTLPSQSPACYALVGLLTSELGPPAFSSSFRQLDRNNACDNGLQIGGPSFAYKTLGYSGGAVPESHRVPCTSALPQERPTTNAQFIRRDSTAPWKKCQRPRKRKSRITSRTPFSAEPRLPRRADSAHEPPEAPRRLARGRRLPGRRRQALRDNWRRTSRSIRTPDVPARPPSGRCGSSRQDTWRKSRKDFLLVPPGAEPAYRPPARAGSPRCSGGERAKTCAKSFNALARSRWSEIVP